MPFVQHIPLGFDSLPRGCQQGTPIATPRYQLIVKCTFSCCVWLQQVPLADSTSNVGTSPWKIWHILAHLTCTTTRVNMINAVSYTSIAVSIWQRCTKTTFWHLNTDQFDAGMVFKERVTVKALSNGLSSQYLSERYLEIFDVTLEFTGFLLRACAWRHRRWLLRPLPSSRRSCRSCYCWMAHWRIFEIRKNGGGGVGTTPQRRVGSGDDEYQGRNDWETIEEWNQWKNSRVE